MIFQWRQSGVGYQQIARRLNDQGIPSPSKLHYMRDEVKTERFATAVWHVPTVKKLLSSEVYIGHMVQDRSRNNLPAGKKMCWLPKSQWIVVRNTHEAIIDEETFRAVQNMAEVCRITHQERLGRFDDLGTIPNILRGLVFCADCKRPMIRYKSVSESCSNLYYSYICHTHAENPASCPNKNLRETKLIEILWDTLRQELAMAWDLEKLVRKHSRSAAAISRDAAIKREIEAAQRTLDRAKLLHDSLFQNYADKLMTEWEYTEMRAQYRADMEKAKTRLEELGRQRQSGERQTTKNPWLAACGEFRAKTELTADMAHALIGRVEIGTENHVSITLRYRDEYRVLIQRLEEDGKAVPA